MRYEYSMHGMTRRAGRRGVLVLLGSLVMAGTALTGCNSLLDVDDPDIVDPGNLGDASGLAARRLGAFGDFALAYAGAPVGGGGTEGQILASGLFADEFQLSGTFPTRIEIDARKIQDDNSSLTQYFEVQHLARRSAESTRDAYLASTDLEAADKNEPLSEMGSLAGFTYVFFGENFCSGVPFSRIAEDGSLEFGSPVATDDILDTAIANFDEAIARAVAAGNAGLESLARLGKGRTLLDLGRFDEAAAAVTGVPTDFQYLVRYSENTDRQENGVFSVGVENERWTVANSEGINGLPYRDVHTAGDPRTPWVDDEDGVGFDTSIQQFDQAKYPDKDSDAVLADGIEARLIEAEAALQVGDVAGFEALHDALRATIGLAPISTAGLSQDEIVDLHFAERAYWLWLTGHRHGDLRRLVRQYGRTEDEVFPTGAYFKVQAGDYGDDVNFPVPFDEENNPNFEQCIDRDA